MDSCAQFAALAEDLCANIERPDDADPVAWLSHLAPKVADLYSEAFRLQISDADYDAPDVEGLGPRRSEFAARFGSLDQYSLVFDPYEAGAAPVIGSLTDDLVDLYNDLESGLVLYRQGDVAGAGAWWRDSSYHWGWHALGFLRAVHFITR